MNVVFRTVALLVISNTFMTFAWYAHLKNLGHRTWFVAALVRSRSKIKITILAVGAHSSTPDGSLLLKF